MPDNTNGYFGVAMVRKLVSMGFDRSVAERQVAEQLRGEKFAASEAPADRASVVLPLTITLPWSALISDRARYAPTSRGNPPRPVIILTEAYRGAKAKAKDIARRAAAGAAPLEVPLQLVSRVWVPDNRRHDVVNFAKCAHDAFEGLLYTDDKWLYDSRWIRAGVDVDHPRAEISITPLTQE